MVAPRHHMDFQSRRSLLHGPVLCYSVDHVQWHAVPLTRNEVVVGRDGDCDLSLEHSSVSRFHARISLSLTTDQVEDLQSRNGCFVEGKRSAEFQREFQQRSSKEFQQNSSTVVPARLPADFQQFQQRSSSSSRVPAKFHCGAESVRVPAPRSSSNVPATFHVQFQQSSNEFQRGADF